MQGLGEQGLPETCVKVKLESLKDILKNNIPWWQDWRRVLLSNYVEIIINISKRCVLLLTQS